MIDLFKRELYGWTDGPMDQPCDEIDFIVLEEQIFLFSPTCRDDALKINMKNIQSSNAYNFHKQTDSDPFGVKYDFCSIMHYGNTGLCLRKLLMSDGATRDMRNC